MGPEQEEYFNRPILDSVLSSALKWKSLAGRLTSIALLSLALNTAQPESSVSESPAMPENFQPASEMAPLALEDYSQVTPERTVNIAVFQANNPGVSTAEMAQTFSLVSQYLTSETYGTVKFTATVFQPIPFRAINCLEKTTYQTIRELFTRNGVQEQNYQIKVLAFPQNPRCLSWTNTNEGQTMVYLNGGGDPENNGRYRVNVAAHEIGHTLGLGHDTMWDCPIANDYSTGCRSNNVGGRLDIMGVYGLYRDILNNLNGPHKIKAGAISQWAVQNAIAGTNSYQLYRIETKSPGIPQILRINKPDSISDAYYAHFQSNDGGVVVTLWDGRYGSSEDNYTDTKQVIPASTVARNGLLTTGDVILDTPNGTRIEVTGISSDLASLLVTTR